MVIFLATTLNLDFIYLFFNISLLIFFIIGGYNVSRGASYWKNAFFCTFFFVLIMGSRYNRGNDYAHYVDVYVHGEQQNQLLFWSLNYLLRDIFGVGKSLIFYIYAIPFILSAFKFLEHFKKNAKYTFPLFLIAMTYFEEYEIRQALGFTFVFLFLSEFISTKHILKRKFAYCSFFAICTLMVHSANILFLIVFLCFYYTLNKVISYKVSIALLLFSTYAFVKLYDISYLMPVLQLLGGTNEKFAQYTEGNAAEAWFGESAYQLDNARNPVIQLMEIIGNASLFYFSSKLSYFNLSSTKRNIGVFTNIYIVGECGKQAFVYLEIMSRMSGMLQRMWFIPMTFVLTEIKFMKLKWYEKFMYISMFFIFYDYAKYLLFPEARMTMFLWDKV